jgi:ADP-ribose pyrophosphatase YjhB (NUDIX family)
MVMKFCADCGQEVAQQIPDGDDRPRFVCQSCEKIHYVNPKLVVGCIPTWEDKILMVKRAIEPRYGLWTLPAGYLEGGESVADGARRETREEAKARLGELTPYAMYNLPEISQLYLIFRAPLLDTDFGTSSESLETRLFLEEEIPWDQMAFKVIKECLKHFFNDRKSETYPFFIEDIKLDRRLYLDR